MTIANDLIGKKATATAFNNIAWGLLFLVDILIGSRSSAFDLLPDIVCWILISMSLTQLMGLSPEVKKLRNISYTLAIFSLFDFLPMGNSLLALLITTCSALFSLYLLTALCALVREMSLTIQDTNNALKAEKCNSWIRTAITLMLLTFISGKFLPVLAKALTIPTILIALYAFLEIFNLMHATALMCQGYSNLKSTENLNSLSQSEPPKRTTDPARIAWAKTYIAAYEADQQLKKSQLQNELEAIINKSILAYYVSYPRLLPILIFSAVLASDPHNSSFRFSTFAFLLALEIQRVSSKNQAKEKLAALTQNH